MPRAKKTAAPLTEDALELVAGRFRALGDPSRLRLLNALMQREHSVQQLIEETGLTQTNVSRHLGLLRRDGIVGRRAEGNRALYRIVDPTIRKLCDLVCGGLSDRAASSVEALAGAGI